MTIGERFRRWRATRGYGIHSPLAFRLVTRAVRPARGVIYYGEEQLHSRNSRLLLRIVAELQPAYVWTSPGLPEPYMEAIRLAGCVVRIFDGNLFPDEIGNADMVVLAAPNRSLKKAIFPGKSLVALDTDASFISKVKKQMKGGIILDGVTGLIAVATSDPALHSYEISPF